MNILIANINNIRSNEIKVLARVLNRSHNVTVASMAYDCAYRGQAFTMKDSPTRVGPLVYKEIVKNTSWVGVKTPGDMKATGRKLSEFDSIAAYEFFSNPADAISIMLSEIMSHNMPDLVICGINNATHMGQDVYSSSNTGMAMEAAYFGVPVIAVGTERQHGGHSEEQLEHIAAFIDKNIKKFAAMKLPPHTFLNINVPMPEKKKPIKGVKVTRMGKLTQLSTYKEQTDSKGENYYWAELINQADNDPTDKENMTYYWFDQKYITVTPLSYDATDYEAVNYWNKTVVVKIREVKR